MGNSGPNFHNTYLAISVIVFKCVLKTFKCTGLVPSAVFPYATKAVDEDENNDHTSGGEYGYKSRLVAGCV